MFVGTEEITDDQIAAAVAAMKGDFKSWHVRTALARAGVQNTDRAADRIMQRERKAGRIVAVNNKNWRAV